MIKIVKELYNDIHIGYSKTTITYSKSISLLQYQFCRAEFYCKGGVQTTLLI